MVFMFFFIPIIKWNKKYYIKTSCCEKVAKIDSEDRKKKLKKVKEVNLNIDEIDFGQIEDNVKICTNCGYTTEEDLYIVQSVQINYNK